MESFEKKESSMRTLTLSVAWGGLAVVLAAELSGCNAVSDDCGSYASCGDAGAGGAEGDSGAPGGGSQGDAAVARQRRWS